MQIAVYILTVAVIAAGMIHTISLILRTIAARKIIQIYAPIYNPNEWMTREDLITNAKIYALTLYQLSRKETEL